MYKVYLAKLKRTDAFPKCVYKVGITGSRDAMTRLNYSGADEPNPINKTFPDIKVMNSIVVKDKETAEYIESNIMKTIQSDERWFHNWYEPTQFSGVTETRKWNYEEVQHIFYLMGEYKDKYSII
jgi:hypothetical protein